jgi:hypothetical protein
MLVWTESAQRLRTNPLVSQRYGTPYCGSVATGGRADGPYVALDTLFYPQKPVPSGPVFLAGARLCGFPHYSAAPSAVLAACWGGEVQVGVYLTQAGALSICSTGQGIGVVQLATTANGVYDGAVRYLSFEATIDGSAGTTKVYLDGVELTDLTLTGAVTKPQAAGLWDSVRIGFEYGWWVPLCDLVIADGTDPSGTGLDLHEIWMDARVDYLPASGNGYSSQMVGSDADSTDNYLLVAETSPDDDTSYVESVEAAIDAYLKAACPLANATILGAAVHARAKKTDAGVASAKVGLRSGTTNLMGDSQALSTDYVDLYLHVGHDPAGGAFTQSSFDAMQAVVESATTGVAARVTQVGVELACTGPAVEPPPPPANAAPVVEAGAEQSVSLGASAHLVGSATDDGLPDPPAALTYLWTVESGPGTATFSAPTALDTLVSFGAPGIYVLRLTADDSELTGYDEVAVTVTADQTPPPPAVPPDLDAADDDVADDCVVYSTRLVNLALSRIHVSKQLANLATDSSQEAATARLHYTPEVNGVLADFPWPFATRYAELELIDVSGGTPTDPVNGDWQYAYRAPELMVFARRIVPKSGRRRAYDPNPIPFRPGTDDGGVLIYCNESASLDVPLELEYTVRPVCPALMGGPAFRSAVAWRLAASLAGPLARDVKLVTFCLQMYALEIANAKAQAANEAQQDPDGDAGWITGRD